MNWDGKVMLPAARENGNTSFFERLTHRFEHAAFELRQLIQEEHAMVGEGNLTRRGLILPPRSPASLAV